MPTSITSIECASCHLTVAFIVAGRRPKAELLCKDCTAKHLGMGT